MTNEPERAKIDLRQFDIPPPQPTWRELFHREIDACTDRRELAFLAKVLFIVLVVTAVAIVAIKTVGGVLALRLTALGCAAFFIWGSVASAMSINSRETRAILATIFATLACCCAYYAGNIH